MSVIVIYSADTALCRAAIPAFAGMTESDVCMSRHTTASSDWLTDQLTYCLTCSLFERGNLLVVAVHDFGGVYAHPLLKHRAVDAAEVDGVLQVLALRPVFGVKGRVLGVESAVDRLADDERAAA